MAVEYNIVKSKYELELPNFEIQMKTAQPTIDNNSFTFGSIKGTDNLYDNLLNNLQQSTPTENKTIENSKISNTLQQAIQNHLGEKYSQARRTSTGYADCSSFVGKVLKDTGINVFNGFPTAEYMYNSNKVQSVSNAKPGDLIFFKGTDNRGKNKVSHIGIVYEVDDNGNPTKMAHASSRQYGKSVIIDYNPNYWNKYRPEIKRIIG